MCCSYYCDLVKVAVSFCVSCTERKDLGKSKEKTNLASVCENLPITGPSGQGNGSLCKKGKLEQIKEQPGHLLMTGKPDVLLACTSFIKEIAIKSV